MKIYCLVDPRTGEIRYVGVTMRDLIVRLEAHVRERKDNHKNRWILQLVSEGLIPAIRLVQDVPKHAWQDAERYWVSYFRSIGCPLTNLTAGGDGIMGFEHSEDTKIKMSHARKGKPKSEDQKAKTRASLMGHQVTEETRAKMREARKHYVVSDETRAKMSTAMQGRTHTAEAKARMSAAKMGHDVSAETRAKLREARKNYKASDETRAKMSAAIQSRTHTAETRAKMSAAKKGVPLSDAHRAALSKAHKGYVPTEEARANMRAAVRRHDPEKSSQVQQARRRREADERAAFNATPEGQASLEARRTVKREQARLAQQRYRDRQKQAR